MSIQSGNFCRRRRVKGIICHILLLIGVQLIDIVDVFLLALSREQSLFVTMVDRLAIKCSIVVKKKNQLK